MRDPKKVIRLLEPSLCLSCRFAKIAEVTMADGTARKMFECKRGDCDNWGERTADMVQEVRSA